MAIRRIRDDNCQSVMIGYFANRQNAISYAAIIGGVYGNVAMCDHSTMSGH